MTVSPNRPQDGNPQHKVEGTGVEPCDRTRAATLPPTLFRLPNLGAGSPPTNPEVATDPMDQQSTASRWNWSARPEEEGVTEPLQRAAAQDSETRERTTKEPVAWQQVDGPSRVSSASSPVVSNPVATNPEVSSALSATSSSATSTSSAPSSTTTTGSPVRPFIADVPAGRSWMDSLGSHGVVIVLLLVVVAAALLTGQSDEDPTAKSLSTQSELLDFDELNVDLPLPTHDGGATLAESQPAVVAESSASSYGEAAIAATPAATVTETHEPVVQTPSTVAAEETPMAPQAAPVATLEAPQAGASGGLDHEFNQGFLSNGVKANEFVKPNGGVDAMTAGNRVDSAPADSAASDSALPSLEELAGLQEQSDKAAASTSSAPTRRLTKTPVGVSDWSKYLPALNSADEPDAGTSSFSNQVLQP